MFISPIRAIEEGWVTHPQCNTLADFKQRSFISPNALDFTLDRLFSINEQMSFFISEQGKDMRGGSELFPRDYKISSATQYWLLNSHSVYDGMSDFHVTVPEGVAAALIIRSTLNRNGLFITSGIYDQGFSGAIGFAIHNRSGVAYIAPGTRIGQLIFYRAENSGIMYAGGYNTEQGKHWTETGKPA